MVEPWVTQALAAGIQEEQLELHLQPIVSIDTGRVFGAESFVRRRHPQRGTVAAREWIPEADRTGALAHCCHSILPAWSAYGDTPSAGIVSLNLTRGQLLDEPFMSAIERIPRARAGRLAIEVPYLQMVVERAHEAAPEWSWHPIPDLDERLAALRARGFAIWLDDYGDTIFDETALRHSQIDLIKLDRSLLTTDSDRLSGLVERVRAAGKRVLIEGIETAEHRAHAIAAGIDLGQGFLFSHVLADAEYAAFCAAATSPPEPR